ncbi:GNAT family N-acetyltransferase [Actinoplanes xinjiangensis]|uniref:Acyl-CoA synthetase (NDP forming) n=1 Tax=Actinoplanes xinjiangensis TaxID=512350 RepID=A0A316F2L4_9ACTN|nr:GNAT family N-acetyltransferase [Actinoplanes xinjiangensis]PWK39433.1 acyl-CoA synthetase (NDP forming) [Actinoplanes xinjiangensis]GIF42704.1 GNAT family N-acetyltransferase [Actinoplanes xinjiangensis]
MTTHHRPAVSEIADALTVDGGIVSIRPITARDRRAISALYADASPDNLRLRFFARPGSATLAAEVDRLCRPASDRFLALLACEGDRLVGVASCERMGDGPRAEFAVFIADHDHGRGIGTLLLEHLTARGRRLGITEFVGEVLPANRGMLRVAHDLSSRTMTHFDRGIVDVSLHTGDDEQTRQAIDERDRTAERASLQPLFNPRSVAVIDAGHSTGREALQTLREYGFTGRLYPIDPAGTVVDGLVVRRSLRDVPEPVDLLVIAVPADQVAAALTDGAAAGARAAILLSAGFEDTEAGRHRLADVLRLARSHGIRLVGPNSLGVVNTDPRVRLDASTVPASPRAGGLSVAAQSPAVAAKVLEAAVCTGTGVSTLVALGDKADVSGNDLLAYWYDDPATRAVALFLESYGNPRKFARTVSSLSLRKPVLAIAGDRPPGGRDDGLHTAALDAMLGQAGVVRPRTIDESLDTARILTDQPLPSGTRLAILSNSSDLCRLAADTAEAVRLRLPATRACTRRQVARVTSQATSMDNPIDLSGDAIPVTFASAASAVADSGSADMLLIAVACTRANRPDLILAALGPVVDRYSDLPIAIVLSGYTGDVGPGLGKRHAPIYHDPERAVRALAHAAGYADWLRHPHVRHADLPGIDKDGAGATVSEAIATRTGRQPRQLTARILAAYGITILTPIAFGMPVRHHPPSPVELVATVIRDPLFGSLVLLGPSGAHGDTFDGWAVRPAPMTEADPRQMWRSLACASLLSTRPDDTAALENLMLRLDRLAEDHPEIAELTLNLVLAGTNGLTVVDAELRLAPVRAETDPLLRRLSPADKESQPRQILKEHPLM